MSTGTVKWFDHVNGLGFIAPDDGSNELAVDVTALERAGLRVLGDGQRVIFRAGPGRFGRPTVEDLRLS